MVERKVEVSVRVCAGGTTVLIIVVRTVVGLSDVNVVAIVLVKVVVGRSVV
jgi:hypothetical protein